ncbi:MAG: leucine-rich repeat protein, partial [Dorea sp.]|nr:leucine-rich repeat protein [Dorea sp.]
SIGTYAFYGCSGFKGTLKLPEGLKTINYSTFESCSGLSGTLRIPDSVKSINCNAFKYCSGFTNVVFGSGTMNLYGNGYSSNCPFYRCSGIETVTFLGEKVPVINTSLTATSSNGNYIRDFFSRNCFEKLKTIYVPESSLNAYKTAWKNYVPASVTFSADTMTLPVANLRADYVNSHSLCLTWNPSTSKSVVGYNIYRDEVKIADATEEKFSDTDLEANQTYKYKVTGYTGNDEETLEALLHITTRTPKVNKIYTDNKLNKIGLTNGWLYASVDDTGNLKSAKGRFYYLDENEQKNWISDELTDTFSRSSNSAVYRMKWDIADVEPGSYMVGFELVDSDGEKGELSQLISVDDSRPEALSNITAIGGINQIILSWSIAHEIDTEKYYIYRRAEDEDEYTLIKRVYDRNTLTYTDTKAMLNQKYYYYITGVNSFGQEGERSKIAIAMPQTDTELPRIVQLTPVNNSLIGGNTKLYMNAEDNVSVTKTELYLSLDDGITWMLLATTKESHCGFNLPTGMYNDQSILIKGLAYDASGNVSTPLIYSYKIDNTGPEQVTGLSYESTATTITLRWKDVADNDFSFFRVEQKLEDGSFRSIQDVSTTLGANIYNLESDREYVYRVAAYDQLGNRGRVSEEITARTQADTTAPVITAMKPNAGYYNKEIPVRITATDNTGIASVLIQTSDNAIIWNDYKTINFGGTNKAETVAENISLEGYAEGNLYIRGIAKDKKGNSSDSSDKAPYVQYIVDRTAPKAPKNFKSNAVTGAIELEWDMGEEADLDGYTLYRSLDGEQYSVLAKGLHSVNYWDRSVKKDTCYWYKAAVCDLAGNISEETAAVSASLPNDTEKPKIENFSPASGSTVGMSNQQFSVMVSDNWKLDTVKVTYTINDNEEENTLINQSGIDNYYKVLNANLPITSLKSGDILYLNISVTDMQGLSTVKEKIAYTVDKTAPRVEKLSAEADKEKITIKWKGNEEPDLAGYRIYRKKASDSYELIGQRSAAAGQDYQYEDYNALPKETYNYKVEAVDKCGNTHAKESEAVWLLVEPAVIAEMVCDKMLEVNVEYYFDAAVSFADLGITSYRFEFGDGDIREGESAKIIHRYEKTGDYSIKMTVTDSEGRQASVTKKVTVQESRLLGTAKIKVVDASGNKIIGLPVYFDMDHTSDNVKYTDSNGYVTFNASAGSYAVGSYGDGYLPVKKSMIVRAGTESQLEITLVKEAIVTGEFEIDRMTLDEIKAAGIDVSNPANQQVVQVTVHLTYGSTPVTMDVVTNGKNIYSGETVIVDTSEGRRKLTAAVIDTGSAGNKGSGTGGTGTSKDENIILAILDVPIEASFLKEFFDVKLHIINHADSQFELTNNSVQLHVPKGMTMVDSTYTIANDTMFFDSLKGQSETTLHWILRGDKAGEYDLEADYRGVLKEFNAPVSAKFKTETPITVYGLDAVKIIADINSSVFYGGMYFDLSLQNKGGADIYLPSIDVDGQILNLYEHTAAEGESSGGGGAEGGGGAFSDKTSNKDVKLLDVLVKNKKAYTQYLGKNAVVEKLSVGETLTKKYVSYNAITENDVACLREAVVKAAEDLGVEVEVNIVNMDLFSIEDADDKALSFFTDPEKRNLYDFFINNQNFKYYIDAEKDDEDFGKKLGEAFKRATDAVLNFDFEIFTNDDMKHITRQYIYELLMDESFQRSTYDRIDDTYLKVTKSTLSVIKGWLPQDKGDVLIEDAAVKNFVDAISDAQNIRKLAGELKVNGSEGFYDRLYNMALAEGASVIPEVLKHCLEKNEIIGCIGSEINKSLKETSTVLGVISDATSAWNTSAELTNQLIAINAAQEEARILLSFIIKHEEINEIVRTEAQEILNGMNEGIKKQSDAFTEEFAKNLLETGVGAGTGWILGLLDKIYYPNAAFGVNAAVTAIRLVYNSFDYVFGWEDSVNSLQRLRVAGALTLALRRETIGYKVSGDNETFLMALKYLIKMRLVGEKAWVDIYRDNGIKSIESDFAGEGKQDIDEYYKDYKEMILSYRDILFGQIPELQNIPKAPEVEIDYVQETTVEKYDSNYEYSFNGTEWTECDGGSIALMPGNTGKHLWVRKKESASNMAGNITKRYVPARALISDDISVKYKEGNYYIEGLSSKAYYQLSDKRIEKISVEDVIEPRDQVAEIKNKGKYYPYMAISLAATKYEFSSRVSNYEVEKARILSVSSDTSGGSVTGAGEYFAGERVAVKAQAKTGYTFAGWYQNGELLSVNSEYAFTIHEDCKIEARFENTLISAIQEAKKDEVVKADLPLDSIVPKEVLEAAAKRDVLLKLSSGDGTYWEIDGRQIVEDTAKDLDLRIIRAGREDGAIPKEFIDNFAGTYSVEQLNLSESFRGMPAVTLKLEMDTNKEGWKCVTFLCDENKNMSVVKNCILSEDTMAIDVSKGGNYLIVYGKNGDVTMDNQVTMKDLMKILHHVSGRKSLSLLEEPFADVDLQNGVKMADLMKILHYVSGKSKAL